MQSTYFRACLLASITNIEVAKTNTSFLAFY